MCQYRALVPDWLRPEADASVSRPLTLTPVKVPVWTPQKRAHVGQYDKPHNETGEQRDCPHAGRSGAPHHCQRPNSVGQRQQAAGIENNDHQLRNIREPLAEPAEVHRNGHRQHGRDAAKNGRPTRGILEIQRETATVKILVIPTNEELEIAEQTVERIRDGS